MISRNMVINSVFTVINVVIFFILAKLLLFCAELAFTIDQQTNAVMTGIFLVGGFLCALYVIYKNSPAK